MGECHTKKDSVIDFLKGFAILSVIYGHLAAVTMGGAGLKDNNPLAVALTSFQMPMFIMISGYLSESSFEKDGIFRFIKKKIFRIVVPCLVWTAIVSGYRTFTLGVPFQFRFYFWYLYTLMACYVIELIIRKILLQFTDRISYMMVADIFVMAAMIAFDVKRMFLSSMYPFFVSGIWIRTLAKRKGCSTVTELMKCVDKKIRLVMAVCGVVAAVLFQYRWTFYVPDSSRIYIFYLRLVIAFFVIGGFVPFVVWFVGNASSGKGGKIISFVERCGSQSLELYLMQTLFIRYILSDLFRLLVYNGIMFFAANRFFVNFILAPAFSVILTCGMLYLDKIYKSFRPKMFS